MDLFADRLCAITPPRAITSQTGGARPIQKSTSLCLNCIALTGISRSSSEAALKNYEDYGATGLPVRADTVAGAVRHLFVERLMSGKVFPKTGNFFPQENVKRKCPMFCS